MPSHGFVVPYTLSCRNEMPVTAMATDYLPDHETSRHDHPHIQLSHAVLGVMVVSTSIVQWIVPPTCGLWVPAGVEDAIRMVRNVEMRTAFIRPGAASCAVLGVSPLLRELILAAVEVPLPYAPDSRHGPHHASVARRSATDQNLAIEFAAPCRRAPASDLQGDSAIA